LLLGREAERVEVALAKPFHADDVGEPKAEHAAELGDPLAIEPRRRRHAGRVRVLALRLLPPHHERDAHQAGNARGDRPDREVLGPRHIADLEEPDPDELLSRLDIRRPLDHVAEALEVVEVPPAQRRQVVRRRVDRQHPSPEPLELQHLVGRVLAARYRDHRVIRPIAGLRGREVRMQRLLARRPVDPLALGE
jgi:hypothetical protein